MPGWDDLTEPVSAGGWDALTEPISVGAPTSPGQAEEIGFLEHERKRQAKGTPAWQWAAEAVTNPIATGARAMGFGSDVDAIRSGIVADVGAPLLRSSTTGGEQTGMDRFADSMHRFANAQEQVAQERGFKGFAGDVQGAVRGGIRSVIPMAAAGLAGGQPLAIGMAGATQYSSSLQEGRDAGLEGADLQKYAATQGGIEAGVTAIFSGLNKFIPGLGGAESAIGAPIRKGVTDALKRAGISTLAELTEEEIIAFSQQLTKDLHGVDPDALSGEKLWETGYKTALQTLVVSGAANAPGVAGSALQDRGRQKRLDQLQEERRTGRTDDIEARRTAYASPDNVGEVLRTSREAGNAGGIEALAGIEKPSRKQWEQAGLDPEIGKSGGARSAFAAAVKGYLATEGSTPPVAPEDAGPNEDATDLPARAAEVLQRLPKVSPAGMARQLGVSLGRATELLEGLKAPPEIQGDPTTAEQAVPTDELPRVQPQRQDMGQMEIEDDQPYTPPKGRKPVSLAGLGKVFPGVQARSTERGYELNLGGSTARVEFAPTIRLPDKARAYKPFSEMTDEQFKKVQVPGRYLITTSDGTPYDGYGLIEISEALWPSDDRRAGQPIADYKTLLHEALHLAKETKILTPKEADILEREYAQEGDSPLDREERAAEAHAEFVDTAKTWEKLKRFFRNLLAKFGIDRRTAQDIHALMLTSGFWKRRGTKPTIEARRARLAGQPAHSLQPGEESEETIAGMESDRMLDIVSAAMYKKGFAGTWAKETAQNAFDAGSTQIDYYVNSATRKMMIADNGEGMLPETVVKKGLPVAATSKSGSESRGQYGLAKVALFMGPKEFTLTTRAKNKAGKVIETTVKGTSEGWRSFANNPTNKFKANWEAESGSIKVGGLDVSWKPVAGGKTGTKLTGTVPAKDASGRNIELYGAHDVFSRIANNAPKEINITKWEDSPYEKKDPSKNPFGRDDIHESVAFTASRVPVKAEKIANVNGAKVQVNMPTSTQPTLKKGYYVPILNRGLWQFDIYGGSDPLPVGLSIDVAHTVDVENANYPWTTDRDGLKGEALEWVDDYLQTIQAAFKNTQTRQALAGLEKSPTIAGTNYKYADIAQADPKGVAEMASDPTMVKLSKIIGNSVAAMARVAARKVSKRYANAKFGGFMSGGGFFGINAAGTIYVDPVTAIVGYDNGVLDMIESTENDYKMEDFAEVLSDLLGGIMLHEMAHQISSEEGEWHARAMTFLEGAVTKVADMAHNNILSAIKEAGPEFQKRLISHAKQYQQKANSADARERASAAAGAIRGKLTEQRPQDRGGAPGAAQQGAAQAGQEGSLNLMRDKSERLDELTRQIAEREFQAWEKTLSAEQRELMDRKYGSYKSALKDYTKKNRAKIVDMALAEMQAGNPVTPIQGPPPAKDVTDPFRKTEGAQWQEVPQNLDEYMRRFKEQYGQDINRAAGPKSDTIHTDDTAVYSLKSGQVRPIEPMAWEESESNVPVKGTKKWDNKGNKLQITYRPEYERNNSGPKGWVSRPYALVDYSYVSNPRFIGDYSTLAEAKADARRTVGGKMVPRLFDVFAQIQAGELTIEEALQALRLNDDEAKNWLAEDYAVSNLTQELYGSYLDGDVAVEDVKKMEGGLKHKHHLAAPKNIATLKLLQDGEISISEASARITPGEGYRRNLGIAQGTAVLFEDLDPDGQEGFSSEAKQIDEILAGRPDKVEGVVDQVMEALDELKHIKEELVRNSFLDERMHEIRMELEESFQGHGGDEAMYSLKAEEPTPGPIFFSKMLEVANSAKVGRVFSLDQLLSTLDNAGVKKEEIEDSHIKEHFQGKKKITKDELLEYLGENAVKVEEVPKGGKNNETMVQVAQRVLSPEEFARWAELENQLQTDGAFAELDGERDYHDLMTRVNDGWMPEDKTATKFGQYQLPGGQNYRELLLTVPAKNDGEKRRERWRELNRIGTDRQFTDEEMQEHEELQREVAAGAGGEGFRSSHWDEPNVLAHVRFNDRTDADGKKVLFIEEIQSDWHQQGRKQGYKQPAKPLEWQEDDEPVEGKHWQAVVQNPNGEVQIWKITPRREHGGFRLSSNGTPVYAAASIDEAKAEAQDRQTRVMDHAGVPDAPFKKSWPMLAMKRMIRWASENGYDRVAWTPGSEQNKRYNLAAHVSAMAWKPVRVGQETAIGLDIETNQYPGRPVYLQINQEGEVTFADQDSVNRPELVGQRLVDIIGQEPANQVMSRSSGRLTPDQLIELGGEGMKGFYDQILPSETNKIIKKYGARVGKTVIGEEPKPSPTKRGKVIEVTDPSGELMWQAMIGDQKVGPPERLRVDAGHYLVDALSARGDKLTIIPVVDEDNPGDHPREYEYEATPTGWDRIEGNTLPPTKVHAFDITPSMRKEVVEKGLPAYSLKDSLAQFSGPIKKGLSTAATLAKAKFNKSFFSDIPDEVVKEDLLRQGKVAAELRKMSHIANELQDQLIRERGNRDLTEPELKVLDDALKGEKTAIQKLTPKIAEAIGKMRHHIKQLSLKFIASGLTDGDLAMTIVENMESYVTRSYRKFDDPDWAKKIPAEVRAAARKFIRSEFPKLSDHEINLKIEDLLYEKDAPLALIKASKLGSKDLTVLMKRQDIPAPIRALMGEYHHPFVNYMRSVARMSNTLASHDFLVEAREAGMGVYFWDRNDPKRPLTHHAELANKDDKTMRPLAGVMTTPEIAKAFQNAYKRQPEVESVLLRTFFAATGLAKYMKTVGNFPMGYLRNFISNVETLGANGNLFYITPTRMRQAAGSVSEDVRADLPATARVLADWAGKKSYKNLPQWAQKFFTMTDEQWQADTERMVRLHVYDESVHANELRDAIRDVGASSLAGLEGMTEYTTNKFLRNAQKTAASASSLYQAMDNFWRRIHFEAERAKYKAAKKGLTDDQLDLIAADNVRRTFHTYSMIPPAIKQLRKVPLIAPFVSFTSETLRTKAASLRLAWEEMQDPDLKRIGQVRMASNVASLMAVPTMAMAVRYLLGYDWEDDQNLREFVPPWSRNSDILFLPGGTKDNPKWVDMSYTSPSSYLRKPVYALLRNENPDLALREAFNEIKEPFIGEELFWEKMTDISRNSTDDGVRIWGPADSNLERMRKQTTHLLSSLEPGTLSSLRRIEKARTGFVEPSGRTYKTSTELLAPLTGFRVNDTDISVAIKNASRVYSRQIPEITVDFTRMATGPGTTTPDEVKQGYLSMNAKREQHFRQMTKRVEAAINSGVPEEEIYSSMLEVGIGKDAARQLLANYYQPYVLSDEALKKMRKLKDGQARYEAYLEGYQEASEALTK
jgi:hypothetical protein